METLKRLLEQSHRKINAYESILHELEADESADFCEDCHIMFFERLQELRRFFLVPNFELDDYLNNERYFEPEKTETFVPQFPMPVDHVPQRQENLQESNLDKQQPVKQDKRDVKGKKGNQKESKASFNEGGTSGKRNLVEKEAEPIIQKDKKPERQEKAEKQEKVEIKERQNSLWDAERDSDFPPLQASKPKRRPTLAPNMPLLSMAMSQTIKQEGAASSRLTGGSKHNRPPSDSTDKGDSGSPDINSDRSGSSQQSSSNALSFTPINSQAQGSKAIKAPGKAEDQELAQLARISSKKDFSCYEVIDGKRVNILQGLELHKNVLSEDEQEALVNFVLDLQVKGRNQQLRDKAYSEPSKWMRGKGRVTIQFGCFYNYAVDKDGHLPGILRDSEADPLPDQLLDLTRKLLRFRVLPSSCVPDSAIINIYDVDDCIPPRVDHHDFLRPFCTLSLLSEAPIVFGSNLRAMGPGEFKGSHEMVLPKGSVLVIQGNSADVAKHSIPVVPHKRISITLRKMDPAKLPLNFSPGADLAALGQLSPAGTTGGAGASGSVAANEGQPGGGWGKRGKEQSGRSSDRHAGGFNVGGPIQNWGDEE